MPLSDEIKKLIMGKFKVESLDTVADLGKALRRACVYSDCASSQEWNEHINQVRAMSAELFKIEANELVRPNTQGYNALQCAIKSLMDYAKTKDPKQTHIINRLMVLCEVARFIIPEHLNQDEFFKQYISEKYKKDFDLIFVDLINNRREIPEIDLCIQAAKEILSSFKQAKDAYSDLILVSQNNSEDMIANLPPPIILLTDHSDVGTGEFFKKYSPELSGNGYKLLCAEIARSQKLDEFLSADLSMLKFRNYNIPLSADAMEKFKIIKLSIKSMQDAGAPVEFIDIIPSEAHKVLMLKYMTDRYHLLNIIEEQRDITMTYLSHTASIKYKTGAVMLVGINHYDNLLNYFTRMMHITPNFALLTQNLDALKRKGQASSSENANFIQAILSKGVKLIDMSQGDFNLKGLIGGDELQRTFSKMKVKA